MIHFVYGEDSYQVREYVFALKKSAEEAGASSVTLDAKDLNPEDLRNHLHAGNLFKKKSVLILKNVLSQGSAVLKERAAELFDHTPQDTDIIIWEDGVPDRRTLLYKALLKKAKVSEKVPLKGVALQTWIQDRARDLDVRLNQKAAAQLAQSTGPDLAQVQQELMKLKNFVGDRSVTEMDINELVSGSMPPNIFELLDRLGGNKTDASLLVERLLVSGEEPLYLLSMLAYQLRMLILVVDLRSQEQNITSSQIARKLGMHPFVAQKMLQQAQHFSMQDLVLLHRRLTEMDIQIKTGAIDPADALFILVGQRAVG